MSSDNSGGNSDDDALYAGCRLQVVGQRDQAEAVNDAQPLIGVNTVKRGQTAGILHSTITTTTTPLATKYSAEGV